MTTRRLRRAALVPARHLRRAAWDATVEAGPAPEVILDQVSGPFPHRGEAVLPGRGARPGRGEEPT